MPIEDVPSLVERLLADPGRPRLTWYGPGGERVELSGKVLENWTAKTANLLLDELDAGPGSRVGVLLPTHWRAVVWLLAVWRAGAEAVLDAGAGLLDVAVTTAPRTASAGAVVAVALPALATRFDGDLPPGALDAAAEVRLQPDAFGSRAVPDPDGAAVTTAGTTLRHGRLLPVAAERAAAAGVRDGDRVLTGAPPQDAVGSWLGPLVLDGSLVLHHDLAGLPEADRERLARQEAVTWSAR